MSIFQGVEVEDSDESWSFKQLRRTQTSYLTHDYHKYPAKFIPQLAERLIKENSNSGDLVCDPFMGSGTTILEAIINSRRTYGSDINPVSVLISRAKTTPIEPSYLKDQTSSVLVRINADLENRTEAMTIFGAAVFSSIIPDNKIIASAYRSFTLQIKRMSIKNEDLWNRMGGKQADCVIYNNDARRINLEN